MATTQSRLKELLHYDPESGVFTRRKTVGGAAVGSIAGSTDSSGHRQISIDGRGYMAHRLAFLYVTGEFPQAEVDHINRNPDDNRWNNLRPATRQQNQVNVGVRKNSTSGRRGVSWDSQRGKWRATGRSGGRTKYLGLYTGLEEAATAAQKWREEVFGEFAAA